MTSFKLKLIALAAMLTDHTGVVLAGFYNTFPMRIIGRIAFPIYVFLIAEGCRHTRDIRKYMLRLAVFAIISEVPFDLVLFGRAFDTSHQNIFFTLFLGVAAIWLYERLPSIHECLRIPIACIPFAIIAYLIKTDYNAYGVLGIYACYVMRSRAAQLAALAVVFGALYINSAYAIAAVLLSLFLLAVYNGKKGYPLKLAFYAIYPAHLLLLAGIRIFLR